MTIGESFDQQTLVLECHMLHFHLKAQFNCNLKDLIFIENPYLFHHLNTKLLISMKCFVLRAFFLKINKKLKW